MFALETDEEMVDIKVTVPIWHRRRPFIICQRVGTEFSLRLFECGSAMDDNFAKDVLQNLLLGNSITPSDVPECLDHLIVSNEEDSKALLTFSPHSLFEFIKIYEKERFKTICTNSDFRIQHEGKFLFPTFAYSSKFYEIGAIFESNWKTKLLKNILSNIFSELLSGNEIVISISKIGERLGFLLEDIYQDSRDIIIHHYNTLEPDVKLSFLLKLPRDKEIIIFVDVIATGESLDMFINKLHAFKLTKNIKAIVCVCDIREKPISRKEIFTKLGRFKFEAICWAPTRLYVEDKPKDWFWSEIERIDPFLWKIRRTDISIDQLWKPKPEDFIKNAIHQADGIEEGHFNFSDRGNHYSYFFLTQRICEKFGKDIAESILKDVNKLIDVIPSHSKMSHIIQPSETVGISQLSKMLISETGASLISVSKHEQIQITAPPSDVKGVILLDSAISSGETIWSLLDKITYFGAEAIYVYTIMNRAPQIISRRFAKLQRYNGADVTVNQIVSLPIPVYKPAECPLCKKIYKLNNIIENYQDIGLDSIAKKEIEKLYSTPIQKFIEPGWVPSIKDKNALEERVKIRLKIQAAIDNDPDEWGYVMGIFDEIPINQPKAIALVQVLHNEIFEFLNVKHAFPMDFRTNLFNFCLKQMKEDSFWHEAVGVAVAFSPNKTVKNLRQIVTDLSFSVEALYTLLLEIILHKTLFDMKALSDALKTIKEIIYKIVSEGRLSQDGYKITAITDQIIDNLGAEEIKSIEVDEKIVYHFRILYNTVFKKGLTLHPRLREIWTFIAALSLEKASEIIGQYYFSDNGLNIIVRKTIIPHLLSLEDLFKIVLTDRYPYFRKKFKDDMESLNRKIYTIMHLNEVGLLDKASFDREWENESTKELIERMHNNIIAGDNPLSLFLSDQFCKPSDILVHFVNYWNVSFSAKGINLSFEDNAKDAVIFMSKDTFSSIVNNLMDNIIKYAFNEDISHPPKAIVKSDIEDKYYIFKVLDNGIGINDKDKKTLHERVQSLVKAYDSKFDINSERGFTVLEMKAYREEHILCPKK